MESFSTSSTKLVSRGLFLLIAATALVVTSGRAGLTLEMQVFQYGSQNNYTYYFDPQLRTNSSGANVSFGNYYVASFDMPTNGSSSLWRFDTNGFYQTDGVRNSYGDFNSMVHELTNGVWSLFVTNATITNVYYFTVKVNIASNDLPKVLITSPVYGSVNVTNRPTFTWQGPANYSSLMVSEFNTSQSLPASQTSWVSSRVLYDGPNNFNVNYASNSTTAVVASIPTNSLSQPVSGWVSTNVLSVSYGSQFSVGLPDTSGSYHALVAHYPFDATNGSVLSAAIDTSGNGCNMSFGGSFGSLGGDNMTTYSAAGVGAVQFHDGNNNSGGYLGWTNPTPPVLLSTLAGSFSVSCWIKTTQNIAWNSAPAFYGAGIVSADVGGLANDVVPIALTGGAIAFNTGDPTEDVTLNSIASVNDGNYHHIVVTRNQQTGKKTIYIDGAFDSFASGTTNSLSDPQKLTIGALANAGNPDPNDGSYYQGYDGELDDLQIYSGVLSADEVVKLYANPGTTVANGANPVGGHTSVAQYTFDNSGYLGQDSTTNHNDINCGSGWGSNISQVFITDAVASGGAVQFFGDSSMVPCDQSFVSWSNTFIGSFSVSAWIKTTHAAGNDTDSLSDISGNTNQAIIYINNSWNNGGGVIPLGITGSKAACFTGDKNFSGDTLHSTHSITTGSYVHVVVTRDQDNGQKAIYINGVLDADDYAKPGPLNGLSDYASIGGSGGNAYQGKLDDVQIYSGVLNSNEVAYLYNHPGLTASNVAGTTFTFNDVLGTSNLNWTTSGDTSWFVETTNTHNGAPWAAQSGSVTNSQTSTLEVTVTGPGTLTFYWSSIANDPNTGFSCEFDVDGNYSNNITGDTAWYQDGSYIISSGTHTLSWKVSANGDTDPTQAGFLDQVSFVAINTNFAPSITVNPFNQTNYPGYTVALFAAATSNPAATWEWFQVGGASSIPNATNALFIPTNSGTAGVAGSYYAIASNLLGTAISTTATVSFVSAPLPPDWSRALKSPFAAVDATTLTKDYYLGCAVDSAGDIYAAAQYFGNMDVLTNGNVENILTTPGNYAAALVKHAANGNPLWAVGLTNNQSGSYSYGIAVAVAPGNGAYLASDMSGTNWLGTNKFVDVGGNSIVLSRFDANGSNVWSKLIGGTNVVYTSYNMLVADVSGNVTLLGHMSGTVSFGGTNLSIPAGGGFIVQYDANGVLRWAQTIPVYPYGLAYGNGLLFVSLQSTVAGGVTNASMGSLSNITDRAWAVACLNATNGQALWLRGVGDQYGANYSPLFTIDRPLVSVAGSDVFMTGNAFGSSVVFGGLSVSVPGGRGQYFARYDTNGNPQVATAFGNATTMIWASAANASGVYVSGDFDNYSQFGSKLIAAPVYAQNDLGPLYFTQPFVAKFDRNGNPLWARNGVSSDLANFRGIALASDGVWACGFLKITNSIPAQFGSYSVSSDLYIVNVGIFAILNWTQAGMIAKITDSGAVAVPVTLLNPQDSGANFQFQFLTQTGFTNAVQYCTNLIFGLNWQTYSNVIGDGTLKIIEVPLSVFSPAMQGFIRVSTQ